MKEEEPPHLDEVPVPVDRRDRANCHMEKAYYVIEAMRELAADPQNFDVPSAPTVVEHMAIRAQTLALAGMCALDNPTIADEPGGSLRCWPHCLVRHERKAFSLPLLLFEGITSDS